MTKVVFLKRTKVIVLNFTNAITPNSDGINDTWTIPYLEAYETAQMKIFDKYGKTVYDEVVQKSLSLETEPISEDHYLQIPIGL